MIIIFYHSRKFTRKLLKKINSGPGTISRCSHYYLDEFSLPVAVLTTRAIGSHYRALFSLPEQCVLTTRHFFRDTKRRSSGAHAASTSDGRRSARTALQRPDFGSGKMWIFVQTYVTDFVLGSGNARVWRCSVHWYRSHPRNESESVKNRS